MTVVVNRVEMVVGKSPVLRAMKQLAAGVPRERAVTLGSRRFNDGSKFTGPSLPIDLGRGKRAPCCPEGRIVTTNLDNRDGMCSCTVRGRKKFCPVNGRNRVYN